MAVVCFIGFETGDLTETGGSGGSISSSIKRSGDYSCELNPTAAAHYRQFGPPGSTQSYIGGTWAAATSLWAQFFLRVGTLPSSKSTFFRIGTATNTVIDVQIDGSGNITLFDRTTNSSAAGTVTADGQWHKIRLKAVPNGTCELSVDDGSNVTLTGLNQTPQRAYVGSRLDSVTYDLYYDDIVIDDASFGTTAPSVLRMDVDGQGSDTGWTGTSGDVDEVPPDGDTTYITSSTSGQQESVTLESASSAGISGTIRAAAAVVEGRRPGPTNPGIGIAMQEGGTTTEVTTSFNEFVSNYGAYVMLRTTNPRTSAAWTTSDLDGLVIRVRRTATGSENRVTSIYAMVLVELPQNLTRELSSSIANTAALARVGGFVRTEASSIANTAALARVGGYPRDIAETIAHAFALARAGGFARTEASSIAHAAALDRVFGAVRAESMSVDHVAVIERALTLVRDTTASIDHAATLARTVSATRALAESIAHTFELARLAELIRELNSSIAHDVTIERAAGVAITRAIAMNVAHSAALLVQMGYSRDIAESIDNVPELLRIVGRNRAIDSTIENAAALDAILGNVRAIAESIAHAFTLSRQLGAVRGIDSTIAPSASVTAAQQTARAIAESIAHAAALDRVAGLHRGTSSSIAHAFVLSRQLGAIRGIDSTIAHDALVVGFIVSLRGIDSTIAHDVTFARALGLSRDTASSVPHTATFARHLELTRSLASAISPTATIQGAAGLHRAIASAITHDATFTRSLALHRAVTGSIPHVASIARHLALARGFASSIPHVFTLNGSIPVAYTRAIASSIPHSMILTFVVIPSTTALDTGCVLWEMVGPFEWRASGFLTIIEEEPAPSGFIKNPTGSALWDF